MSSINKIEKISTYNKVLHSALSKIQSKSPIKSKKYTPTKTVKKTINKKLEFSNIDSVRNNSKFRYDEV
jgi:hypothetical protein